MTPSAIIDALGGTRAVADEFHVNTQAVSNWRLRGLPKSRLVEFLELVKAQGKTEISADILIIASDNGQ